MQFIYLDESKDDNKCFVYSALILDADRWPEAFDCIKAFRRKLRIDYGIYVSKELHAWKFAAGKDQIADRPISKEQRAHIFREVLQFIADAGEFSVISSINTNKQFAFERLVNRLNKTAEVNGNQKILLFCDQGEEEEITKNIRRMRIYNPIPSNNGYWAENLAASKNIPLKQFVEDPIFKESKNSHFIQLVDFCAYALLRMERPIESRTALGYHKAYEILRPVCHPPTNRRDHRGMGIIR